MEIGLKLPTITAASDFARHFQDDVWRRVAKIICQRHQLSCSDLRRCEYGENIIFFVDARFVVKIFAPFRQSFQRERAALEFADGKLAIETPQIVHAGEFEGWSYIVMTQLAGVLAGDVWVSLEEREQSEIVSRLGASMSELHAHAAPLAEVALNRGWQTFIERQARTCVERQRDCGASHEWLESLPAFLDARMELLPADYQPVLLHGDIHLGNLLLAQSGGGWRISGLFDFGDSLCGFHEYEFVEREKHSFGRKSQSVLTQIAALVQDGKQHQTCA